VVEDDANLGFVIKDNLRNKGYDVILCSDGDQGLATFLQNNFDLCILDVMLPRQDGFSLARAIRGKNKNVPILFLTAKTMIEDKLEGFETGADDYITKPFSLEELYYRIEVFLRRASDNNLGDETKFQIGAFLFDAANFELKNGGDAQSLTSRESDILKMLVVNRDRVLKREEILMQVWGDDDYFLGRSLDVFISKLRKYLRDDSNVQITNHHGVGFRLEVNS
jgi:DNA-binding response OmpR family regulator